MITNPFDEKQRTIKSEPKDDCCINNHTKKCRWCNKNFNYDKLHIDALGAVCDNCMKQWQNQNQQMSEEIKRMAWEIYFLLIKLEYKPPTTLAKIFNKAWETATVFYNMAKEKEQDGTEDE
jgi:hypothetical protein